MEKEKKQFRLFDVYRQSFTGIESNIKGIRKYACNKDAGKVVVNVVYDDGYSADFVSDGEEELKKMVKKVNKEIKKLLKPFKANKVKEA